MQNLLGQHKIYQKKIWVSFFLLVFSVTAFSLIFAQPAYANPFELFTSPDQYVEQFMVGEFLGPTVIDVFNLSMVPLQISGIDKMLTGDFNNLFGAFQGAQPAYDFLKGINQTVLVPLGQSILSLIILVQFVKISQKIDANATMPVLKEIMVFFVIIAIFSFVINHGFDLCEAIYNEIAVVISSLGTTGAGTNGLTIANIEWGNTSIGTVIVLLLIVVLMFVFNFFAAIIGYVMCLARALQIYVLAAFSPVPCAFMGFEETRSWGIGFFKNFLAVCLAGAIMLVVMQLYPMIMTGCLGNMDAANFLSSDLGQTGDNFKTIFGSFIQLIAVSLFYIYALLKSGTWARDILGG